MKINENELKKVLKGNRNLRISAHLIKGGSVGPLTCTNAHLERNAIVEQEVLGSLKEFGFYKDGDLITNNDLSFKLLWILKRTYTGEQARKLDPSYQTYWAKILYVPI